MTGFYTGRAFALNSLMINAGWMAVNREDVGSQTYWRLYIRAQKQDGSEGQPIQNPPWDLNARYNLDPIIYEAGGQYGSVPSGYWIDFTALAQAYGWNVYRHCPTGAIIMQARASLNSR